MPLPCFRREHVHVLLLATVVLTGAALRLYRLGANSLWYDEAVTAYLTNPAKVSGSDFLLRRVESVVTLGPAYYSLVRVFSLLDQTEFALRLPSVIAGILAILCTYQIARIYSSNSVALLSSLLLCFSAYHVYFSQEARPYAMQMWFGLGSTLMLVEALKDSKLLKWVLYILITALGFYFHVLSYMALMVLAQGAAVALGSRSRSTILRKWLMAQLGILVLLLPWLAMKLPVVLQILTGTSQLGWSPEGTRALTPAPTAMLLRQIAWAFLAGKHFNLLFFPWIRRLLTTVPDFEAWCYRIVALAYMLVITKGIVQYLGPQLIRLLSAVESGAASEITPRTTNAEGVVLFSSYLIIPLGVMYIISFYFPMLTERHAYVVFPAYVVLLAFGINSFKSRAVRTMLVAGFLVVNGISLANYYFNPQYQKEQWRDVAEYVEYQEREGDVVVFYADYVQTAFDYYYHGSAREVGLRRTFEEVDEDAVRSQLQQMINGHDRVWLVLSHDFGGGELARRFLHGFLLLSEEREFKSIKVYLYQVPPRLDLSKPYLPSSLPQLAATPNAGSEGL